jgi:glycosyltransferase involved in cell wall biosynthesis
LSARRTLVLFTASYPFGVRNETFLENEIPILVEWFDEVLVLPSRRRPVRRPLPEGAELVEMAWLDTPPRSARIRALANGQAWAACRSLLREPERWGRAASGLKSQLDIFASNLLKANELRAFIEERGLQNAIYYDYWFENSTLALSLLRASGEIPVAVARAHGFDVYDERWPSGEVPFRELKANGLDRIFPVSEHGRRYLLQRIPSASDRIEVQRLGVVRQPLVVQSRRSTPLVVSCGSLLPFKRTDWIPGVLELIEQPVRWIHFGDGPERQKVEEAARRLPSRVRWELRGDVPNAEVLALYREERVDAFISMSVYEGVPVSMMEAISFGIPLLGMEVYGVPEIIGTDTGICLPVDAKPRDAANALGEVLKPNRFDPATIRRFFTSHYDAANNYREFANRLRALQ